MPTKTSYRMPRAKRKQEILNAILYSIENKGLFGFVISDIAEYAECSTTLVRTYFGGIAEIQKYVVEYAKENNIEKILNEHNNNPMSIGKGVEYLSREDRKEKIFKSILHCIAVKGFFKFTAEDVRKHTGCSKGLVISYYGGAQQMRKYVLKYAKENNIREILDIAIITMID